MSDHLKFEVLLYIAALFAVVAGVAAKHDLTGFVHLLAGTS